MSDEGKERVRYYAGLDLGQPGQFSALAVLEKRGVPTKWGYEPDATYAVRHMVRFPPGAPYSQVVDAVRAVFATPPVNDGILVVDQTAVGKEVFQLVRDADTGASVHGVTITAGNAAQPDERGGWLVPKKDLAGTLQVLLQGKRIKVAETLEYARTLVEELQQFQLKTVRLTQDATIEWRERPHDDLVLAVAIAAWQAEQYFPFFLEVVSLPRPSEPRWWRP